MLKYILNLEGSQEISASEQKTIVGTTNVEASKCETWNSIISFEDCADYYPELYYSEVS
ncbi:hypothetical protein [Flavobacterium sp. H4147]|uniref:hypothetical protein n=1 Tax=Flavobacterium sp. H4147 TaxID=3034149 RepID=UPI0023EDB2A8|nr:hypothetical protein [Flavobacterium sp. H4147]